VHRSSQVSADRETQADTAAAIGEARRELNERIEDRLRPVGWNSGARVGDARDRCLAGVCA
jgi:hypothetical protein